MIRSLLRFSKRRYFKEICHSIKLNLDYKINKEGLSVLEEIFIEREYADYFPFYEKVTIVDIGSHFGYFSIFASRNTNPPTKILAIEPDKKNFEIFKQNLSSSKVTNVIPLHMAVGEKVGTGQLYKGASTNNSLIANYPLLKKEGTKSSISIIDLKTLLEENEIEKVDFLKLDCEGAEYPILLNTSCETLRKIKVISMEFHDLSDVNYTANKIVAKLKSCGFSIKHYKYKKTRMNLNYGRLVAVKVTDNRSNNEE